MKKPLVLAIAAMALTAGAQAESKFYGKMNLSVAYEDSSIADTQVIKLNSNASRLGVKGSEALATGTKILYQAEYQTDIDAGDDVFKQRDSYVGLAYVGMGTIKMGIMDTPVKKSQGKFDLFNDVYDIKAVIAGDKRLANSINYTTEKLGSLQASVSYIMQETDGVDDGVSASLVYSEGDVYASVAMDSKTEDEDTATVRATVLYTMGDIRLGALLNSVDESDTADSELGFGANASYKMGANTAKIQFLSSDQGGDLGETAVTFGVDHKLAKGTKAYAYVNLTDTDVADSDTTGLSFGLEHKF
ncbi:MAG: putative porin [Crocinitomicaceae bacterium]|jgi:predicted porin